MKVPVERAPLTSVATTVVPVVPLGTKNMQLNPPGHSGDFPVVSEPDVQVVIATPSKTNVARGVSTENP